MSPEQFRPFESIESAYEFVALLEDSAEEAVQDVREHIQIARMEGDERRVEALTLALYKMTQLTGHMHKSRRILKDLRTIRRLLYKERAVETALSQTA
jgi:hypothetical protein